MRERDHAKEAAEAHSNLSMFYAIIALCESGSFYGYRCHAPTQRIIKICQAEGTKHLRRYDAARAKIGGPTPKRGVK